ncbi:MAG: diaminopimelate epimerase [Bacillota bacterium]
MKFTKMEGCGNDYIYINCFEETVADPSALAIEMSDRHFGIGADGLVLICPSVVADVKMRMFNSDGSEGDVCGNATSCIAKYVYEKNIIKKDTIMLETNAGIRELNLLVHNEKVDRIMIDMGEPILDPKLIPVNMEGKEVVGQKIMAGKAPFLFTCLSMGNPHAITFVLDVGVSKEKFENFGRSIECNPLFPKRTNVEFVEIQNKENLNVRVWERGSGETLSCGTGACASVVAAVLNGYCEKGTQISVRLAGGTLKINWNKDDNHVYMTGFANFICEGEWLR